jgi:hypothetical protein
MIRSFINRRHCQGCNATHTTMPSRVAASLVVMTERGTMTATAAVVGSTPSNILCTHVRHAQAADDLNKRALMPSIQMLS